MRIDFTDKEKEAVLDIIRRYREASGEGERLDKRAEEIKAEMDKIREVSDLLERRLKAIAEEEKVVMESLHCKYGDFRLQDIYDTLNDEL